MSSLSKPSGQSLINKYSHMAVWTFPPLGPIWHLDVLVLLMCLVTFYHAFSSKNGWMLVLTSALLGLFTEHASLRFGGTHCHASGIVNFSECSSANSVLYYIPWCYICLTTSLQLTSKRQWMFPFLSAMLFFGMCGVYEMQGPLMGWWLWPRDDGIVKPNVDIWQFGDPGNDSRGMVTTLHVKEALSERVYGFPPMAPYFHSAFGFGIALAMIIIDKLHAHMSNSTKGKSKNLQLISTTAAVLLGPALGMIWDPPIRILKHALGAGKQIAVPGIMGLAFLVPLLFGSLEVPKLDTSPQQQICLFLVPLLNHTYFVYNALLGHGRNIIPGNLKFGVLCVAAVSLIIHARAARLSDFMNYMMTPAVTQSKKVEKEAAETTSKRSSSRARSKSRGRK